MREEKNIEEEFEEAEERICCEAITASCESC